MHLTEHQMHVQHFIYKSNLLTTVLTYHYMSNDKGFHMNIGLLLHNIKHYALFIVNQTGQTLTRKHTPQTSHVFYVFNIPFRLPGRWGSRSHLYTAPPNVGAR